MLQAIKWLVLYVVVQFGLLIGVTAIYIGIGNEPNLISDFISEFQIYLVIILGLIFIPLLLIQYKKFNVKESKYKKFYLFIIFSMFLSIFYNIFGYYFDKHILGSNLYGENSNVLLTIISTVLIGPIIEELMFRGYIYNSLKKEYSIKKSCIITSILFALCHFNFIQMIYTFLFSLILINVFEKYKSIKYPIFMHMVSNLTTTFITMFIIKDYLVINIILFFISFIIMYLIYKKCKNDDIIE